MRMLIVIAVAACAAAVCTGVSGERWSRQVSHSEWIPLTDPRTSQTQRVQVTAPSAPATAQGGSALPLTQPLPLSPVLQHQYQEQLQQLQRTQENIQKLLALQRQLKSQQQLLHTQDYSPSGFGNEEEKPVLRDGSLDNGQTGPELVPPAPAPDALPPIFNAQNFNYNAQKKLPSYQKEETIKQQAEPEQQEFQEALRQPQEEDNADVYVNRPTHHSKKPKKPKERVNFISQPHSTPNIQHSSDENNEEIQLVYVPAETLINRGQQKGRSQQLQKPFYQEKQQPTGEGIASPFHNAFTGQLLRDIEAERNKQLERLSAEKKHIEHQAQLREDARKREQEVYRQREAEKRQKELDILEEAAKQRELERLRDIRERQKQHELERQRAIQVAREKLKQEKAQKEIERLAELARRKEQEIQQTVQRERDLESSRIEEKEAPKHEEDSKAQPQQYYHQHQHLTETVQSVQPPQRLRTKFRPAQREHQHHTEESLPAPNQPPLSVYVDGKGLNIEDIKVTEVLKMLRKSKTIHVLDVVEPNGPKVFVGPSNLQIPEGWAKFELPYLSTIENNRVERKVDRLPFFVAPLSFNPPAGYSKIPFPAPHIGSVVINNLDNTLESERNVQVDQDVHPRPHIQPNSYITSDHRQSSTTFESSRPPPATTPVYSRASDFPSTTSLPALKHRFRYPTETKHSHFEDEDKSPATTVVPFREEHTTQPKFNHRPFFEEVRSTTADYPSTRFPERKPEPIREEHFDDFAQINRELNQHRNTVFRYQITAKPDRAQVTPSTQRQYSSVYQTTKLPEHDDLSDDVSPTQYNLPAELPPISPHLPGLVNSLITENERLVALTTLPSSTQSTVTTTPTTTTTTTEPTTTTVTSPPTTTTQRTRGRIRARPATQKSTTVSVSTKTTVDKIRRPYNRPRARATTTTEDYRETTGSYEPTRGRVTEERYTATPEVKQTPRIRPVQTKTLPTRVRGNDKTNSKDNDVTGFENIAYNTHSEEDGELNVRSQPSSLNHQSAYHSNKKAESYDSNEQSPSTQDNFSPTASYEYTESVTRKSHPQNRNEYQQQTSDFQTYEQNSKVEEQPINGFNYRTHSGEEVDHSTPQASRDYQNYNGQTVSVIYSQPMTTESNLYDRVTYELVNRNASAYDPAQDEPVYIIAKKLEYDAPSTETRVEVITHPQTTTTTEAPVVIRQRVRGRLGGGSSKSQSSDESTIQTRPRGSQDEYVRFSTVNENNAGRTRQRTRPRTRVPAQKTQTQVQTDGEQEYVRFQSGPRTYQRPSETTTTTSAPTEEELDYGFFRQPNFPPPKPSDSPINVPDDEEAPIEDNPPPLPTTTKSRLNRRPATKATTTTERSTPKYSSKSKTRNEETRAPTTLRTQRLRRPGARKRPTTTAAPELNELPENENYPRIHPSQLAQAQRQQNQQHHREYDSTEAPLRTRPTQEPIDDRYRESEYTSSYSHPERIESNEEYSEPSVISEPSLRYHESHRQVHQQSGDIYEAESQWSTKLSQSSFQPSYSANAIGADDKTVQSNEKQNNAPDIITAAPDIVDITVKASMGQEEEKKSGNEQKKSSESVTETTTDAVSSTTQLKNDADANLENVEMEDEHVTSTTTEMPKEHIGRLRKVGVRRRIKKIRVRPVDDFVTAESQSVNYSVNGLTDVDDEKALNRVRAPPTTTTEKSALQDFFDEMLSTSDENAKSEEKPVETTQTPAVTFKNANFTFTDQEPASEDFEVTTIAVVPFHPDEIEGDTDYKTVAEIFGKNLNSTKTTDDSKASTNDDNLPSNHKEEWSEVSKYPSDKLLYDYSKFSTWNYEKTKDKYAPPVQTAPSSEVDEEGNTKVLSDYVQSIFNSMKSADEEEIVTKQVLVVPETTTTEEITTMSTTMGTTERIQNARSRPSVENTPPTTVAATTPPTSEIPTIISIASSSKPAAESKLSRVLKTSTSTRVSHMTEICYRGRCVMTKSSRDNAPTK